jgi:ABC-type branched-subunit amino acid transport system ATPase component
MDIRTLIQAKRFTMLLGKNGSGKSTLLRQVDGFGDLNTRYITPERGGVLKYEPGVDNNIQQNPAWLPDTRRKNRFENFRQQSAAQFRNLEILFLRALERSPEQRADQDHTFDRILDELNDYLPAIRLVRSDRGFTIENRQGVRLDEDQISSGEAEFIAQAIELLVFARADGANKILLLDEPDVHLHPDLQSRFVSFIERVATTHDIRVVIATHSTAIVSGFSKESDLHVAPVLSRGQTDFESFSRTSISDQLLPIFGAHPLSTLFNKSPIVLVEGEDDRRILEQFVRSSNGRIARSPCVVGTVDEMARWEGWLNQFLPVLYDTPIAFSLRDLDDATDPGLDDLPYVIRTRLNCYAMENLLLTNESLAAAECDADVLLDRLRAWSPDHPSAGDVGVLVENFGIRRTLNIKRIRNIVAALMGVTKPWEVHLGQVLANPVWGDAAHPHSLATYAGQKVRQGIFGFT